MRKSKLTNKELTSAISGLSNNDQILMKEFLEFKQLFELYLQYRNKAFNEDIKGFNDFVKAKVNEFEKQQRSKIKK
mgnify:CR=1 FL=1